MRTAIVHQIWRPAGMEPFRLFCQALQNTHWDSVDGADLVLMVTGPGAAIDDYLVELNSLHPAQHQDTETKILYYPDVRHDLNYWWAAGKATSAPGAEYSYDIIVLLNAYTRVLVHNWLQLMIQCFTSDAPGALQRVVGAFGSWESWLTTRPDLKADYPMFPNPHLRTNGVMVKPEWLDFAGFRDAVSKEDCWKAESGYNSWTNWLIGQGIRPTLVDKEGRSYTVNKWDNMRGFRMEDQRDLVMADRHTDLYAASTPEQQFQAQRRTWQGL